MSSCWILLVAHLLLDFCFILTSDELYSNSSVFTTSIIFYLAITVSAIVGKGMFESTVIQFGTDQMIEVHQLNSVYSYTGTIGAYMLETFVSITIFGLLIWCLLPLHENKNYITNLIVQHSVF